VVVGGLALVAVTGTGVTPAEADQGGDPQGARGLGTTVLDWNVAAVAAATAACLAPEANPLLESRMYAMTQLAVHDALNAIDRRAESYGPRFHVRGRTDTRAAVAAARDTLVSTISEIQAPVPASCRAAGVASVEGFYTAQLSAVRDGRSKARGIAVGQRAAAGIIALRRGDGSDTPLVVPDFPQRTAPGGWRFTAGAPFAFAPRWGEVKPFALTSAAQFRPSGPRRLTSTRYARDLNEIKGLGGNGTGTASARTAEQTQIALFWYESSPVMWNRVARELARSHRLDGWEQARLLGQLNVALADGYIGSFAAKYALLFWRPETAIRLADQDGNPATSANPDWTPLRTTPPIPDHDSGHAVEGGAGAAVLATFFGTDRLSFAVCSDTLADGSCAAAYPTLRRFHRVSDAAAENALSRIYIGFHFRWSTEVGARHGAQIGTWAATRILAPVCR
jgi:hypothetical protein